MTEHIPLLLEIQDLETESSRLWEIMRSELPSVDTLNLSVIISTLADHPNADDDMYIELLREWPKESLASTRFRLLILKDDIFKWDEVFDDFSEALPVLKLLEEFTSAHKSIISLFESDVLRRFNGLSCSYIWTLSCTHEISIDWEPSKGQEKREADGRCQGKQRQEFLVTFKDRIDYRNVAIAYSPSEIEDIKSLFLRLASTDASAIHLKLLEEHGWSLENSSGDDGDGFFIESIEPGIQDWFFDVDIIDVECSGSIHVTDPTGLEHCIELSDGYVEHTFDNYTLIDRIDLLDIFNGDQDALEAFRKILSLTS